MNYREAKKFLEEIGVILPTGEWSREQIKDYATKIKSYVDSQKPIESPTKVHECYLDDEWYTYSDRVELFLKLVNAYNSCKFGHYDTFISNKIQKMMESFICEFEKPELKKNKQ